MCAHVFTTHGDDVQVARYMLDRVASSVFGGSPDRARGHGAAWPCENPQTLNPGHMGRSPVCFPTALVAVLSCPACSIIIIIIIISTCSFRLSVAVFFFHVLRRALCSPSFSSALEDRHHHTHHHHHHTHHSQHTHHHLGLLLMVGRDGMQDGGPAEEPFDVVFALHVLVTAQPKI